MSEWRTIETAPKDGTYILAFSPFRDEIVLVNFEDGKVDPDWPWVPPDGAIGYGSTTFTHWMPLPNPPPR